MPVSPTQLSLRHLRGLGYDAEVVEHWNAHAGRRQDLFGCIDILALRDDETLAVQCTSVGGVSDRIRKITDNEHLPQMRKAGWTIHVHGWSKVDGHWQLKRLVDVS